MKSTNEIHLIDRFMSACYHFYKSNPGQRYITGGAIRLQRRVKMKKSVAAILFLLSFMLIPQMSSASFISIETTTTITVEGYTAKVSVAVTNKGDEPAHNGRVRLDIGGNHLTGKFMDTLQVNVKNTEEFETNIDFKKPGKYPVTVMVEYTDSNQYPFSALSVTFLNYKEPVNARVVGIIPQISLKDKGKLKLTVNNIDVAERNFTYQMVAPQELNIANPTGSITVDSGAEKTVIFDIKNISARAGSNYAVFSILSYEDDKYHYAGINTGSIIIEKQTFVDRYKAYLIVILVVLVLVVAFYNLKRTKKQRVKD